MDQARIEAVLNRLPELVIELDPDPTARGPAYLQDIIYRTRNMLNETGIYVQEVLRWKSGLESELEALEVAFQVDSDELLTEDQRVTRLPAVQDRQAMINVILRDQRKAILELKKKVNDAGHVEKAVRHRHRELEHTMSAIRLQRSLIETERKTGSFYGDESETSRGEGTWGRKPPKDEDIDEDEMGRLMEQIEEEASENGDEAEDENDETDDEAEDGTDKTNETDEAEDGTDGEDDDSLGNLGLSLEDFDEDVSLDNGVLLYCSVCGEPQTETDGGLVCKNGHGGAPSVEAPEKVAVEEKVETDVEIDEADLPDAESNELAGEDPDVAEDPDIERFLGDGDDDDFSDIFGQLDEDD